MRIARIEDGRVVEIVTLPSSFDELIVDEDGRPVLDEHGAFRYRARPTQVEDVFSSELARHFVEADESVSIGWLHDGLSFSPPPPAPPLPEPAPEPVVVPAGTLFDRLTEQEASALDEAMQKLAVKSRGAWNAVVGGGDLRSDKDIWGVIEAEAQKLFGEPRTAQILARPGNDVASATAA